MVSLGSFLTHLLHLAGILRSEDDHFLLGEVDGDGGRRSHAGGISVGREGAGIVDDIVGVEAFQFFARRADEHVAHEEGMVGAGADHAHVDPVALVPASISIDDVDAVAGVEIIDRTFAVDAPDLPSRSHVSGDTLISTWPYCRLVCTGIAGLRAAEGLAVHSAMRGMTFAGIPLH